MARRVFSPTRFVLVLFGAVAIQIGTNLINDYYDQINGIDSDGAMGSSRVIQEGLLTPEEVWWGGVTAFVSGAVAGLVLVSLCGWPILAIGLASVAAGYYYTASPVALGYLALGELTVFVFMGPAIVVGSYYVMAERFARSPFIVSLPVGLLVARSCMPTTSVTFSSTANITSSRLPISLTGAPPMLK